MKTLITKNQAVKYLLAVLISFLTFCNSFSQYQERSYNLKCGVTSANDFGRSIINRIDKGYAIAGFSYAPGCGIGPYDWMFVKAKPNGILQTVKLIGTLSDDRCYSLIQSKTDSGYVLAGNMFEASRNRATLVKLKKTGVLSYSKRLNDSLNSQYMQVIADSNYNWALTGWDQRSIAGVGLVNKLIATQYNSSGIKNWGFRYDSYSTATTVSKSVEEAYSICYQPGTAAAGGGCYCVAARTDYYSTVNGIWDILLVKLSYTGAVIWKKVYRFNFAGNFKPSTEPRKVIPMPDGGFAVVGFTNAYAQNESDIIVLRVNADGGLIWSFSYGSTGFFEYGNSIVLDGNYLVVTGERRSTTANSPNALLMKIPAAGGPQIWTRIWDVNNPDTESGQDLVKSKTGAPDGYAITGDTYRGANMFDPFLWRTNSNGLVPPLNCQDSTLLNCITNPHKLDSFNLVCVYLPDKKWSPSVSTPAKDSKIICLPGGDNEEDPELELDNIGEDIQFSLRQNYPNPFNPVTNIKFEIPDESFVTMKVFDIAGKEVYELVNEKKAKGRYEVRFDGSNLSTGVYYYKITAGSFSEVKKMMLIK